MYLCGFKTLHRSPVFRVYFLISSHAFRVKISNSAHALRLGARKWCSDFAYTILRRPAPGPIFSKMCVFSKQNRLKSTLSSKKVKQMVIITIYDFIPIRFQCNIKSRGDITLYLTPILSCHTFSYFCSRLFEWPQVQLHLLNSCRWDLSRHPMLVDFE